MSPIERPHRLGKASLVGSISTGMFLVVALICLPGCGKSAPSSPSDLSAAPNVPSSDVHAEGDHGHAKKSVIADLINGTYSGSGPISVVATTGMVGDIVSVVGGDHVEVTQLIGPGVDPHLHKPSRDNVQAIIQADIVFFSGLKLEGKMGDTLDRYSHKKPVIAVTQAIDPAILLQPEESDGHLDPHVWNDVSSWSQCVGVVQESLATFDPSHAEDYRKRAQEYQERLAALHQYGIASLATIPQEQRILVTSHDAFNYFGRAYNLQVLGVQGISTESEAGIQRINELVDLLVEKQVKAVFVETSVPRRSIDALMEGAKAKGQTITIGGELFSDAMGKSGTYEGTYLGMLDHNITIVTRALGGNADAGGFQGKLEVDVSSDETPSP